MAIGDLVHRRRVISSYNELKHSELASPLVSLLGLCSVDFQPYTVADAARATDSASAVVSAASACLRVPFADVQLAALDCLKAFSPAGCHGSGPLGSSALERSDAIQTMVEVRSCEPCLVFVARHPLLFFHRCRCWRTHRTSRCAWLSSESRVCA